jgi:hypothetical protein
VYWRPPFNPDSVACGPVEERRRELTLAQRMGLVERPPSPLTETQWEAVHTTFRTRECDAASERADPCPICREGFRAEQQVCGWEEAAQPTPMKKSCES